MHEAALVWLLHFCRLDLDERSDWDNLGKRLQSFAIRLLGVGGVWPASVLLAVEAGQPGLAIRPGWGGVPKELPPIPTQAETRAIHARLRQVFDVLRPLTNDGKIARVRLPAQIQRVDLTDVDGRTIKRVYGAEWPDWLWLAIAAALEEFGSRIERCQASDCGRLFLRTRRQAYCSTECSQRVRSKRWYEAHKDKARAQRRDAHNRKLHKKYPKVRISRRIPSEIPQPRHTQRGKQQIRRQK